MIRTGAALDHCATSQFVTDGGLETDLIFHHGVDLPEFAAFPLLDSANGRDLLGRYFEGYAGVAVAVGAGLLLETPTWRANPDWALRVGYAGTDLDRVNTESVRFLRAFGRTYADVLPAVVVSGMVGPRGDGYRPGAPVDPAEAADYHRPQLAAFAAAGADLATALTLTEVGEAVGVARAAADIGIPVAISFTVETDGRLPGGLSLPEAVAIVDADTPPSHYLVNCAHPTHVRAGLDAAPTTKPAAGAPSGDWRSRVLGFRVNASMRSHAELDESETLDDGDPDTLAVEVATLAQAFPDVRVLGGCCGTDERHVAAMWGVSLSARGAG
ncbi:putative homocysteine/selenocysteine methylase [Nostocoides japonicum T1-X7]|uniref:Putative homocysteine/selenocysteine methylase n=1 Tax=Nostocoides japonicum T1-X7 TaxID=1194083 RepID=A0A077LW22_9MICO|nr:homocysteine S-methyltransferase family protein [Tetrasphaera japonica]CCH77916.1 putative homocysteine/selenocysteine methylase [Tetrasphaera japonica T1-X7]